MKARIVEYALQRGMPLGIAGGFVERGARGRLGDVDEPRLRASASGLCRRERRKPGWVDMIRAFSWYTSTK
ncbi:hypothetical protein [Nonomuraea sp. NPDC050786]|uniref:hypothetical protein n=1 Tax=Nonomuraea sp. NPDC050786 TaxID=3154840 RepID=UPI003406B8BC